MINWWKKDIFDDLKPFDILSLEDLLDRYQKTLKTFPEYEQQAEEGRFFLGIKSKDLSDPDVKYFHEKYNHPNCDLTKEPREKICMVYKEGRNFNKEEYHTEGSIKFTGGTSNYNGRDGQIRGGWATPEIEEFHLGPVRDGKLTGDWIYLEVPYNLTYNFLELTNNGVPIQIAKKFVKEVESEKEVTLDVIKKYEEKYDKLYPDWSHDFPINGYFQMKKDGLLFPGVWWHSHIICGHSYHRMIMTSFNKMNFPFVMPVPANHNGSWYACSKYCSYLFNNELHYLTAEINIEKQKVFYSFTKDQNWAIERNKELIKT